MAQLLSQIPELRTSSAPPVAERPPRVLLVMEDATRRETLRASLAKEGYEVRTFADLDHLIRAVAEVAPDLVLLDAQAGGGVGVELCGDLRASDAGRSAPIILLSGAVLDEESVARGLYAGADDYVSTFKHTELRARIRVQLRNKRGRDVLERVRKERDAFRRDAAIDPLTQIPNRRAIAIALERAMANGAPFAVLFIDVDHFKAVNDTFGHDVGDTVLRSIAECMRAQVRQGDACGRYGGEEFVIVVRGITGTEMATAVAERHRRAIESLSIPALVGRKITASIGVGVFDPARPDADVVAIERRADLALYEAKKLGRNRVVVASPSHNSLVIIADAGQGEVHLLTPRPSAAPPGDSTQSALEVQLTRQLSRGRAWLPVLPEAAAEALKLAGSADADLGRISRMVDRDPTMAARFLSVANSALYARVERTTSTHAAIVRFGLSGARDLLFQVVYESSCGGLARYREEVASSFKRSVICAHAARVVSRDLGEASEYSYMCGLLHDIGEARIWRVLASMPLQSIAKAEAEALVKKYHTQAGAELATGWRLPAEIADACASHHDTHEGHSPAVKHVMIADVLAGFVSAGRRAESITREESAALEKLRVSTSDLGQWISSVERAVAPVR